MMLLPMIVAVALTAGPVSLQYEGPLKDALKQLAQKGGLNIVVTGQLEEDVQVSLTDVTAQEALESIARIYDLELKKDGKVYVVRAKNSHASEAPAVAPVARPPATPATPSPVETGDSTAEEDAAQQARDEADRLRDAAEAARDQAEAMREQAEDLAEARREQLQAAKEFATAHADIARQQVAAAGPVTVEANQVVKTAVAYGGPVIISENAVVERDAVAFGGDVILKDNAVVKGDAVSFGGQVIRGANSVVEGETVSMGGAGIGSAISKSMVKTHQAAHDDEGAESEQHGGNRVALFLLQFALFFGMGFMLMMFAPQRMKALETNIRAETLRNGLAGLATIPISGVVCMTFVGIPAVILAWIFVAPVAIVMGGLAIANAIGAVLPTWRLRRTQALALALGVLAMLIVFRIPVIGTLLMLATTFVALGAVIRTRFGRPQLGAPILETSSVGATV